MKQKFESRLVNPSKMEFVAAIRRALAETTRQSLSGCGARELGFDWERITLGMWAGGGLYSTLRHFGVIQWVWFCYDGVTVVRVVGYTRELEEAQRGELVFRDVAKYFLDVIPTARLLVSERPDDHDAHELLAGAICGDNWHVWHVLCDRLDEIQDARGETLRRELPRLTVP